MKIPLAALRQRLKGYGYRYIFHCFKLYCCNRWIGFGQVSKMLSNEIGDGSRGCSGGLGGPGFDATLGVDFFPELVDGLSDFGRHGHPSPIL